MLLMKRLLYFGFLLFCFFGVSSSFSLFSFPLYPDEDMLRGDFRIMFYNVENLFDPFDDKSTLDDEFLPMGSKRWNWKRYRDKCIKIGQVITALGGWEPPELIGLCEVENRFVLEGVIKYSSLQNLEYQFIHRESPDRRGIDVALLYQPNKFLPLSSRFFQVIMPGQSKSDTREILYVKGITHTQDTLHVIVNHWPSRWGGQVSSEYKRMEAARVVRSCVDSLFNRDSDAMVVIMGDFNDTPSSPSLLKGLDARCLNDKIQKRQLYNLAGDIDSHRNIGSYKYKGRWEMFDQILVSGGLFIGEGILSCSSYQQSVYSPDFLLERDAVYYGIKPFRTYQGYKYRNGFSDHLPVYLDLWRKK